jgi:Ca2+-binding RTX toxin-like protein
MRRGLVAALCIATAGLGAAAAGGAKREAPLNCIVDGSPSTAQFDVERWSKRGFFQIRRFGNDIGGQLVGFHPHDTTQISCAGDSPAVSDLEQVEVTQEMPPDDNTFSAFSVDLSHGEFGPGATSEDPDASEIEVDVHLPKAEIPVLAPPGPNGVFVETLDHGLGVDVNADGDSDVTMFRPRYAIVSAGDGGDFVDSRRDDGFSPQAFLVEGGAGRDILVGAHSDKVSGGRGADLVGRAHILDGGAGGDRVTAGRVPTVLRGGPGSDLVEADNNKRDWIDCGPGEDTLDRDAHEHEIHGCEH